MNGLRILEDLIKTLRHSKSKITGESNSINYILGEVAQEIEVGAKARTDGIGDLLLMKREVLRHIVKMKMWI